ncbi:MAG: hypothetical protein Q4D32_03295 [Eubacteriales bacterium]|nr:hypothetical protein [Eubacteriales bacterium]
MLDLKAFMLSNVVTIIGIYIALVLTVPVHIKQSAAESSRIFYFRAYISGCEQTLDEEEIEAWLKALRPIRQSSHVIHLELQDEDEIELIEDGSFASAEDRFLRGEIESASEYLQQKQLFCYVEGSVVLTEEQEQLDRVCQDFGMTLEMSDPAGKKQSDAAKTKEQFYKIMFLIAAVCSLIVLFVVEFFWFQSREKAWRVRRLFCISWITIIKETALTQGMLLVVALVAALGSMVLYYHFGIWQIMKSAVMVLSAFLFLVLTFCCFFVSRD